MSLWQSYWPLFIALSANKSVRKLRHDHLENVTRGSFFCLSGHVFLLSLHCVAPSERKFFYFQTVKFNPWNWILQNVIVARLLKEFPAVYDTEPQIFGKSSSYFQIVGSIRVKLGCFLTYHNSGAKLGTSPDAGPVLTHNFWTQILTVF